MCLFVQWFLHYYYNDICIDCIEKGHKSIMPSNLGLVVAIISTCLDSYKLHPFFYEIQLVFFGALV